MNIKNLDLIIEEDSKVTVDEVCESEYILSRIGIDDEFLHMHLAYKDNEDIILKLNKEDLGNVLSVLIKGYSNFVNFKILYEGSEKYSDVYNLSMKRLVIGIDDIEILRIKGLSFLFW